MDPGDDHEATGDRLAGAWRELGDELVRFAATQVGPANAEDVVSTVMVNLLRRSVLPAGYELRPYLFRCVANEAAKHWRSLDRRTRREALTAPAGAPVLADPASIGPDPRVLGALAALSPQQRAVVHLAYWQDMPIDEIARHLGISSGTVKTHLHRARQSLARAFDPSRSAAGSTP